MPYAEIVINPTIHTDMEEGAILLAAINASKKKHGPNNVVVALEFSKALGDQFNDAITAGDRSAIEQLVAINVQEPFQDTCANTLNALSTAGVRITAVDISRETTILQAKMVSYMLEVSTKRANINLPPIKDIELCDQAQSTYPMVINSASFTRDTFEKYVDQVVYHKLEKEGIIDRLRESYRDGKVPQLHTVPLAGLHVAEDLRRRNAYAEVKKEMAKDREAFIYKLLSNGADPREIERTVLTALHCRLTQEFQAMHPVAGFMLHGRNVFMALNLKKMASEQEGAIVFNVGAMHALPIKRILEHIAPGIEVSVMDPALAESMYELVKKNPGCSPKDEEVLSGILVGDRTWISRMAVEYLEHCSWKLAMEYADGEKQDKERMARAVLIRFLGSEEGITLLDSVTERIGSSFTEANRQYKEQLAQGGADSASRARTKV